ncbi:hypothetical protein DAPPUDRAFT_239193 [Daphnia pulex]|uniref:Uncharacterized protein n=1 Tax=Daphnia pulex TaxID=6669 RepID=E9G8L2_DAPPU|nr:hypothetical protein DAPPUDRAFT_239193 [Daphnia pulex]|eukprot:EFX84249.1 hypothetical protein DAPPUDRAFT_239193 [Daphnia pulex]
MNFLFVESCGLGTDILEPTLAFVHDQRSAPSLFCRPSASSLRPQKYNLSYFTDELEHFSGSFRAAVTHLQSLTTAQILTSVRNNSEIRPYLRANVRQRRRREDGH